MINVILSLIYTAYAMLQAEIEARQRGGADVTTELKVLHMLNAAGLALKGEAGAAEAIVHALNRAKDATPENELIVVPANGDIDPEKLARLDGIVKARKAAKK